MFHLVVPSCWAVVSTLLILSVGVTAGLKWFSLVSERAAVHRILDYGMD
jgi:hypothetical protein